MNPSEWRLLKKVVEDLTLSVETLQGKILTKKVRLQVQRALLPPQTLLLVAPGVGKLLAAMQLLGWWWWWGGWPGGRVKEAAEKT